MLAPGPVYLLMYLELAFGSNKLTIR